ncbi:MAG: PKD domain-containing protein [Lewinellaceae bacterium]|nr:PKD domain-containing protein [Lewinellaceae bacterium]
MKITLISISLLLSFAAFSQSSDINKGCAPLEVHFTPPAGATTYFWDFKDGGSSNLSNPANIFTTAGTYDVEFRLTPNGPVQGMVSITVWPKPIIELSAVPESGCKPLNVQFSDNTVLAGDVQVLNRFWVFGDGSSATGSISLAHVYNAAGMYNVSLELQTNYPSCNITQVFTNAVKVSDKPTVVFNTIPNPPTACDTPFTVQFVNNTLPVQGYTYLWNFGNGESSTLPTPPNITYTTLGNFTVSLTVSDTLGCAGVAQRIVRIGRPTAAFTVADTACTGDAIVLQNNSSAGSYAWSFGTSGIPSTSNLQNPTVLYNSKGLKTITLTVTNAGCASTVSHDVFIDEADATFVATPTYGCNSPTLFQFLASSPDASMWSWLFSDSSTAVIPNPSYVWTDPDTTGYSPHGGIADTVFLTVTNPSGCMASSFLVDTVWLVNARTLPDVSHGCAPLDVVFADSSSSFEPIIEWTWLFGDGSAPVVQNNNNSVPHTFTDPGEYEVMLVVKNAVGCMDTSFAVHIEVGEPIFGDFAADKLELCPGDTVHFTSLNNDPRIDAWHFSSDDDRLWHCFQDPNPFWAYHTAAGIQDVSLTLEYNGCFQTVTKQDYINLKGPIAKLHYKTTCEDETTFEFTNHSTGATQYLWTLGDGYTTTDPEFTHVFSQFGPTQVILQAENPGSGCPVSYDTATVYPLSTIAFCAVPEVVCAGQMISLAGGQSTNVNAVCFKGYTWYFKNYRPIQSDQPTLDISFDIPGYESIRLVTEDINGCKDTVSGYTNVYDQMADFTLSDDLICIPAEVGFTDLSVADTTIVSWLWMFGDGGISQDTNPVHVYTTPPPNDSFYIVSLTITDAAGCTAEHKDTIFYYKPFSNILSIPSPANLCEGQLLQLAATDFTMGGSSLSWSWDFDNGLDSTGQTVQTVYPQHGSYTVHLSYEENASGCSGDTILTVNVQSYPQAAFTANVDSLNIICYPQNMLFTNASITDYPLAIQWSLGNGVQSTGQTAATVFPKGTFTVSMIAATSYGCADTTQHTYTVVGPEGTFTLDPSFICRGDSVLLSIKDTVDISSFSWSFGDGTTLDNMSPVYHAYPFQPPSGSTLIKLILRGEDDACSFAVEQPLNFSPVKAVFSIQDTNQCLGLAHQFLSTSTAADNLEWYFGDGGTSGAISPAHLFTEAGEYMVTLIATDLPLGCMDTATQLVEVFELPNIEAYGDTICPGDTAIIGLTMPQTQFTYVWTPSNVILPPQNAGTIRVLPTETTEFTVVVTDTSGCVGSSTAMVMVPGAYTGAQNLDTLVGQHTMVELPVSIESPFTFVWEPFMPDGNPPLVAVGDTSMEFSLVVGNPYGCPEQNFTFTLRAIPEKVKAPNAFTPDGDSVNDVFRLIADGEQELVEVQELIIYNRWGEEVYKGSGMVAATAWNGMFNGKPAPSDVYVWMATVRFLTGKVTTLRGDLTLIR